MVDFKLSAFDEMPQLRTYTTFLLLFSTARDMGQIDLVRKLETAAQGLIAAFPYLAGQVTIAENSTKKINAIRLILLSQLESFHVVVNHVGDKYAPYQQIAEAEAPASMLDSGTLLPIKTFPYVYEGASTESSFIIRANFVEGGLMLGFALMHTVGDGNSLGQIIQMFGALCRGDRLTETDIQAGVLDRDVGAPALLPGQQQLVHDHLIKPTDTAGEEPALEEAERSDKTLTLLWAYYRISASKLEELKAEGSKTSLEGGNGSSTSTDDLLSALVWKSYTIAGRPRLGSRESVKCLRPVNARSKTNPPMDPGFLGNVIVCVYTDIPVTKLTDEPLSFVANSLRKSVREVSDHTVRSHASFWRSTKDKGTIAWGAPLREGDFAISSCARLPVYDCDFGPGLGKPDLVRRPRTEPTNGLAYIMPKDRDGNIDVVIGMRDGDMQRMREDALWTNFMEYIG